MPGRRPTGYLLNVQADLLDHLSTRTVVPLIRLKDYPKPIKELNPVFEIAAEPHVMLTQAIATIPVRELKRRITSLVSRQDEITRALDILLLGY